MDQMWISHRSEDGMIRMCGSHPDLLDFAGPLPGAWLVLPWFAEEFLDLGFFSSLLCFFWAPPAPCLAPWASFSNFLSPALLFRLRGGCFFFLPYMRKLNKTCACYFICLTCFLGRGIVQPKCNLACIWKSPPSTSPLPSTTPGFSTLLILILGWSVEEDQDPEISRNHTKKSS